jgi:glucosamine--fructose-6-phosphate aminotransferase (isomerizing)
MTSHHMIKEIHEQPEAFRQILTNTRKSIGQIARAAWKSTHPERFYLVGCGSSYYAAMIPAFYYEYDLGLEGRAIPSSEFVWHGPGKASHSSMLIALSRSGKTSESVEAIRKAKKAKIPTVAVTSDPTSTMSKECDYNLDTGVPDEQSVIMTKTFTGSALCSMLLGIEFAKLRGTTAVPAHLEDELGRLPTDAEAVYRAVEDQAKKLAESRGATRFIYLGSGANYASCLEGALKLRETSYGASETYHTMEFRHGPFAELENGIQVFAIVPKGRNIQEQIKILKEISATGATVVPISNDPEAITTFSDSIAMPDSIGPELTPILYMIPMQLFAYYYSVKKGRNPDEPRNLTKYVTTEIRS